MATFASPRVQITEIDISQFVSNLPTSVGVIAFSAKRGPVTPQFVSSTRKFKELYSTTQHRLDKGFISHYAAVSFLQSGYAGLWAVRAVADDAKFAFIVVNTSDSTSATTTPTSGMSVQTDRSGPVIPNWSDYTQQDITPCMFLYAWSPGDVGENIKVAIPQANATNKTFRLVITETLPDGSVETRFDGTVSLNPDAKDGYGNSIFVENVLANNDYVRAVVNPDTYSAYPKTFTTAVSLAGGDDGAAVQVGKIVDRYNLFSNTEEYDVDLFIQGGIGGDTLRTALVNLAEGRGDAVAVLDVDEGTYKVADIQTWRNTNFLVSSSYAWAIAPWLKVYDYDNDIQLYIPPSGLVAGMMARCDYEHDPWWVPAGLNRGRANVLGLKIYYSLAERDELDKLQINCFIRKPGAIALWNNRTLQTQESAFSFIEVRRLLNYIKKNVCRTLDQFLFEPLTDFTRERVVAVLDDFMAAIKRRFGVLDYRVVSDPIGTGNNPPNQIDQGMLTVEVYLKPTRAIRFIWLKVIVTRTGYNFEERMV
jgi:hypothetical protein